MWPSGKRQRMPLPSNKIVTYKARETPSNESNSVLMNHRLHIAAQSQSGDDITWKINKMTFNAIREAYRILWRPRRGHKPKAMRTFCAQIIETSTVLESVKPIAPGQPSQIGLIECLCIITQRYRGES